MMGKALLLVLHSNHVKNNMCNYAGMQVYKFFPKLQMIFWDAIAFQENLHSEML